MKNIDFRIIAIILLLAAGCGQEFEVIENLSKGEYILLNQDSISVNFPNFVKGKTVVMGFIFTNCPDTFWGFLKQQLRWARSSQRETLKSIKWLPKYWFTFFSSFTDILTPFFLLAVEFEVIYQ